MMFSFTADRVRSEFLSGEQFQRCCDVIWSVDRRAGMRCPIGQITPGAVVFAKSDHYLPLFWSLKKRRARTILVTTESDFAITPEISSMRPPQVAGWFSTNAIAPDVASLPLGLGNSYCTVTTKARELASLQLEHTGRNKWLYANFRCETHPDRISVMAHCRAQKGGWITLREGGVSQDQFLCEMTEHRFVLCPRGNGIDTHRMWEALYSKTIPVTLRHPALAAFEDLPILFVDDFREVTQGFLEEKHRRMSATDWNEEMLFLPWWRRKFSEAVASIPNDRVSFLSYIAARW